jgi:hypothetical protein
MSGLGSKEPLLTVAAVGGLLRMSKSGSAHF